MKVGFIMHHCPYCGTKVEENELYCIKCGKQLPEDAAERLKNHKSFNKYWYLPISILALVILSAGIYYIFMQNQTAEASDLYNKAEESVMEGQYGEAKELLQSALENSKEFKQADIALTYVQEALKIENSIEKANNFLKKQEYQKALSLINDAENSLSNYNGNAVTQLINKLTSKRNLIKIEELKHKLDQKPSINDMKTLLWEAESIKHDEAAEITTDIRNQIVDYTFSKASENLNDKQFSDALVIVEDGLKYAPNSGKLQSLKTTIDKEKTAFETAQRQRIEQAISSAEEERKLNENDAIELVSVNVENNEQDKLVVKGKVKSVATIPINTILVEYTLSSKSGSEFLSNEVYVYPETLYPDEVGEFEFTHFDIDQEGKNINIKVDKIKWYTNQ
ncbi:zinc ribbon domain-containing protein [Virgibacillus litoralis]|uniref:Nucleic acid-binding Zn ribbon protein n=1 Tax=Virgibacillus litoralis TaxID=578221 RepID=A0ABS4HCS3_9BACI|nr:zinc-ribbon domain-containing protein [Virgibacillus litoralis]MBP1948714.1 putative nucleic acid-binding Zn ribbon protein [Virgibacillus litoralis]